MRAQLAAVGFVIGVVFASCGRGGGPRSVTALMLSTKDVTFATEEPVHAVSNANSTSLTGAAGATLDQCAKNFPSEQLRQARDQIAFLNPAGLVSASNEVVRYKAGGASKSLAEIGAAAAHCQLNGPSSEFELGGHYDGLLAKQVAFSYKQTPPNLPATYEAAIYQYRGDVLDAVYVYRPVRADALRVAVAVASQARHKLEAS